MKSGNLLLGLVTCAAMCACTDNDTIDNGGSQVFPGDVAYMVVEISDVGSIGTKATDTVDGQYFYTGSENEHAVDADNVHFYFYDSNGGFVQESVGWNGGSAEDEGEDKNIELKGYKVVTLHGLSGQSYPAYVVTVLNQPSGFSGNCSLTEMLSKLASASEVGIYESESSNTKYFTMSTSSYLDNTDENSDQSIHNNTYYFATPVSADNFTSEPIEYNENGNVKEPTTSTPVTIYVERLAAKIEFRNGIPETDKTTLSSVDYYKITKDISQATDGTNTTTPDVDLYIRLDGWALNATAKQSYMMKNIDTGWSDTYPGFTWNDSGNERSYWGKSYNYDQNDGNYPTSYTGASSNKYLNYISGSQITNTIGNVEYCAENTNTAGTSGIIQSKNSSAITSILLKATVCDANGKGVNLVRYGSELYTQESYLAFALQIISNYTKIYVSDGNETPTYTQIGVDYLALSNAGDGKVKVSLNSNYSSTTFYSDTEGTELTESVDTILNDHFNNVYGTEANGYNGGEMYYNIPIEHLNDPASEPVAEGMYGVVRNHYYIVYIDKLESLGRGIFDPTEEIVPQTDSETYYLGAQVNILSWKLVEQHISF